jgi:hypothetical protein
MGENAKDAYYKKFSRKSALRKFCGVIEELG